MPVGWSGGQGRRLECPLPRYPVLVCLLCFSDLHCSVDAARRLAARAVTEHVDAMASAGDLATDEIHDPELYEVLAAAGMPIFSVPGNHDGDSYADYLAGSSSRSRRATQAARIPGMSSAARKALLELIDALPPGEEQAARRYLEYLRDASDPHAHLEA
jgi:hypothetical protein